MVTAQDLGALGGVAALIAVAFGIAAMGEKASKASDEGSAMRRGLADGSLQIMTVPSAPGEFVAPVAIFGRVVTLSAGKSLTIVSERAYRRSADDPRWFWGFEYDSGDPSVHFVSSKAPYTTRRAALKGLQRAQDRLRRGEDA